MSQSETAKSLTIQAHSQQYIYIIFQLQALQEVSKPQPLKEWLIDPSPASYACTETNRIDGAALDSANWTSKFPNWLKALNIMEALRYRAHQVTVKHKASENTS